QQKQPREPPQPKRSKGLRLIRLLRDTARRLVQMPTSAHELPLAEDALRLGDREMDLAFAAAVSEARMHPVGIECRSEEDPSQAPKRREISRRRQCTGRATYRRLSKSDRC